MNEINPFCLLDVLKFLLLILAILCFQRRKNFIDHRLRTINSLLISIKSLSTRTNILPDDIKDKFMINDIINSHAQPLHTVLCIEIKDETG